MSVKMIQDRLDSYGCRSTLEEEQSLHEITQEIALAALGRTDFFQKAAGIFCGIVLDRAEASAARRVTGNAVMSLKSEIDRSDYREIRDRFAARKSQADASQAGQEK